jgi:hypothetical protein
MTFKEINDVVTLLACDVIIGSGAIIIGFGAFLCVKIMWEDYVKPNRTL